MFAIQITSIDFMLLSGAALVLWHLFYSRTYRMGILTLASLYLMDSYLATTSQCLVLFGTIIGGFFAARYLQNHPSRLWTNLSIGVLIFLFLMHKDVIFSGFLGPVDPFQPAAIMGFSLVFFKLIHLLVDANQQTLRPLRFLTYLAWLTAFFTWLAGPIARYNDFAEQAEEGKLYPDRHQSLSAANRIVNGCFRLLIICPFLTDYIGPNTILNSQSTAELIWGCLCYFYGFYLYIYLNFSGYCDLVLGLALCFGIVIPENFNKPYLTRNLLDYWRHWHITLSDWFRDYIFTPVYVVVSRKAGRKKWAWPLIAAYSATFLCTGLWHGFTLGFLLFGVTQGLGCIFLRITWHIIQKRASKNFLAKYRQLRWMPWLGCLAMNTYVAFSLLFFSRPLPELASICQFILERW